MKRLLGILLLILCVQGLAAQDYISASPSEENDRIGDLNGAGGVLVLSKRSDLVISVTNARRAVVTPKGQRSDGLYEYEVVVSRQETTEPKVEVNRRGDVYKTDFVVKTRADLFRAYLIEEVAKPIRMEDQTRQNDAVLNASLAAVEFSTTISDLQVDCPKLVAAGAKITKGNRAADKSIFITTVTIPLNILTSAKERCASAKAAYESRRKVLEDRAAAQGIGAVSQAEWDQVDQMEEAAETAERELMELSYIVVYGTGTNRLQVDISELRPRAKLCYGVLLLNRVEKVYVKECTAMMAEGARLYGLREYDNAKTAFGKALAAKDAPADLRPTIQSNIAQCDTCLLYERYALGSLKKIRELSAGGSASQEEVVRYASAAVEFLQVLNRYNPCDFYTGRIKALEKMMGSLPLEVKFTAVRWVSNVSGFFEAGRIPNVEVWAFTGTEPPVPNQYKTDKRFKELTGRSNDYQQLGVTGAEGEVELQLDRGNLPRGIFFRPVGYGDKIKIMYMDLNELLHQSQGTYNKRRFRLKMYASQ